MNYQRGNYMQPHRTSGCGSASKGPSELISLECFKRSSTQVCTDKPATSVRREKGVGKQWPNRPHWMKRDVAWDCGGESVLHVCAKDSPPIGCISKTAPLRSSQPCYRQVAANLTTPFDGNFDKFIPMQGVINRRHIDPGFLEKILDLIGLLDAHLMLLKLRSCSDRKNDDHCDQRNTENNHPHKNSFFERPRVAPDQLRRRQALADIWAVTLGQCRAREGGEL